MAALVCWTALRLLNFNEGLQEEVLLPFLIATIVSPWFLFPWICATHRLQNAQRELERFARTDMLTGLANRWAFFAEAEEILADRTAGEVLAVLMIDLDHFKLVNDSQGLAAGDEVLRQAAALIARTVHETAAEPHSVGRLGGEEFCVLGRLMSKDAACDLAEAICDRLRKTFMSHNGAAMTVTASIGVAVYDDPPGLDTMISAADHASYLAKYSGRDRWCMANAVAASMADLAESDNSLAGMAA
ncbi:GGDEF domain-containing protein [Aurantimonas sp. C2-6-R+9]|nr:GGDEF domain-containing protein [Aurantimonas sp. C2-6-R+9]